MLALKEDFNRYELQRLVQQEVQAYLRRYLAKLLPEHQLDRKRAKTGDADRLTLLKGGFQQPP